MKKILSMLLAIMFIFSCVTFTAGAAESDDLSTPITVTGITGTTKALSPEFLNKWRAGGDMGEHMTQVGMLRSRQFVGATETLRFMPNIEMPNSQMASDGYSITGVTLNGNGYKYIVIPYYYTAPELAVGADTGRYYTIELNTASPAIAADYKLHKSTETMKANQWNAAIIEINSNIDDNTSLSRIYQYPFGATQSGSTITPAVASSVPETHSIDITNVIFCQTLPSNITVTGNAPGRDFYFIASDINDTYVTNHTPNEIIPGNILAGHNAFANTNTAQFVSNGDTTRANGIRWYLSRAHNIPSEIQYGASNWQYGVNISDYNYISVYYYYTVPEGEQAHGPDIYMSMKCRQPAYKDSNVMPSEGKKIANQWAVVTFDITKLAANSTSIKSAATEFMFNPYGNDTAAKNVPLTHSLDIARIVFSKDKPALMDGALSAYTNGLVPASGTGEVPECQISTSDLLNPENANLDGLTAQSVSTDGYDYISFSEDTGDNFVKYWLSHNNNKNVRHSPNHKKYVKVDYFYYKGDAALGEDSGTKMKLSTSFDASSRVNELPSVDNIVYNEWNTAVFNISNPGSYKVSSGYGNGSFNNINLYPFGDASVGATDKVYIANISFCETSPTALSAAYPALKHTSEGEFVPTIENIEYNPQYFKENVNGVSVENAALIVEPFIVGEAVKFTPVEGANVPAVNIAFEDSDYPKMKYRPYVRLEYFMNINDDDFVQGMKPEIKLVTQEHPAGYTYDFPTTLVDGWNAVNLDFSQESLVNETITGIVFYPYGTDNARYEAYIFDHNKIYLNNLIFSQEEITGDLDYPVPEINADGDFLPYKYVPSDGRPVVYYARGGVYTGAAAGSTDQSKAYGTLTEAVNAVNSLGGGYVIMCTDVGLNENKVALDSLGLPGEVIPSHANMVILRGMEKPAGETKATIWLSGGRNYINGPLEIQNLNLAGYDDGTTTTEIRCSSYIFNYGAAGAGYDDITYNVGGPSAESICVVGGSDGGTHAGVNINFNAGTFKGFVHSGGLYNSTTFTNDINVTFNGTDMTGARVRFGYAMQITVNGDVNFTFNGGKFDQAFIGSSAMTNYPIKVTGDYTIKITGGDFSAIPNGSIKSLIPGTGDRASSLDVSEKILDIEDYSGVDTDGDGYVDFDVVDLLAKIDLSTFTTVKANIVYVSDTGSDSNDGSVGAPFATLSKAIEAMPEGGRIFLLSDYVVPTEGEVLPTHTAQINISTSGDKELVLEGDLTTGGPVTFIGANIVSNGTTGIIAGSNKLEFGENVKTSGDPNINGANVTISSGTFGDITGGVTVNGETLDSNVSITVNGGTINGDIVGGSTAENATINGSVNITINGGEINGDVIVGDLESSSKITGLAGITITDGTFNGNTISAGNGSVGDKTSINYRDYKGSSDLDAIIDEESYDLVTKPKAPKPIFSSNEYLVIIEVVGDPTKALTPGSGAGKPASSATPNIEIAHSNIMSTVNNSGAFTAKAVEIDGVAAVEYTPNVEVAKNFNIEGYNSMGKAISTLTYKYVTMQIKLMTTATDTAFKPSLTVYPGGVQDSAYKNKTFTSETPLVAGEWTNVTFMIKPEDETAHMTRQFHYMPLGNGLTVNNLLPSDRVYISRVVISENPVTLSIPKAGGASQGDAVLNSNDPVAVGPESLMKSRSANSFRAAVVEYDGKTVSQIKPLVSGAPIEIDASAVFKDTGATPDGALDVNTHKYAVIKYYYQTNKSSNAYGYEFELSGDRIWDVGNVLNASEIGGPPLEANKWATLVIELSSVKENNRTSGFIFRPFGEEAAKNFRGDKLYIESITFTTTQP